MAVTLGSRRRLWSLRTQPKGEEEEENSTCEDAMKNMDRGIDEWMVYLNICKWKRIKTPWNEEEEEKGGR